VCLQRLTELAPPFDSANPAKLAAIAQTRSVRAGLALTRETRVPPVSSVLGPRSVFAAITSICLLEPRGADRGGSVWSSRAQPGSGDPRLQLVTNQFSPLTGSGI
jgi:hypothetical protein